MAAPSYLVYGKSTAPKPKPVSQPGSNANSTTSVASAPNPGLLNPARVLSPTPVVPKIGNNGKGMGVQAVSPQDNVKPTSYALPANQAKPSDVNIDVNYQLKPGESSDQYMARVFGGYQGAQAQEDSPSKPSTPTAPQGYSAQNNGLYGQLIADLGNRANTPNAEYAESYRKAQHINDQLAQSKRNQAQANTNNQTNPIPLEFQQGRGQVLQNQYLAEQNALSGQLQGESTLINAANAQQGLQQGALQQAAGLAAPQQVGYNVQYTNPLTGQPINGGGGGTLQDTVATVAQRIQSGSMSYDQGVQALSAYGQGGQNALLQALGPNFNVSSSNANAGAIANRVGTSGQLSTASQAAISALDTLQEAYDSLGGLQKTSIPFVNQLGNALSSETGVGRTATSNYGTVLGDARSQLGAVLNATGGTPTGNESTVNQYLPLNMTSEEIPVKIAQAKNLIQQRIQAYSSNENVPGFQGSGGSGGLFDW